MNALTEYITSVATRGACTCGKCCDASEKPEENQPKEHSVDLTFFKVSAPNVDADTLRSLVEEHLPKCFDGKEHSYVELGGDVGNQGVALMLIGIGHLAGLWHALSPAILMPDLSKDLQSQMAGAGMVALRAGKSPEEVQKEIQTAMNQQAR